MQPVGAVRFTALARLLAAEARRHGLVAPGFRFPPRLGGARRTIRRLPGGGVMVSIRVRGREEAEVVADMVDGVLAANGLEGTAGAGWRLALLQAIGTKCDQAA